RQEVRVEIGQAKGGGGRAQVNADDARALLVHVEEARAPAARGVPARPLRHPLLPDQLFDNDRDRAALEARMAGQVGPRNGLVTADQVEYDAPVDVASRLTRGHLKIGEVNLSHVGSADHLPLMI